MKKLFLMVMVFFIAVTPALAGKLKVGSQNKGNFHSIRILGAEDSYLTDGEAVIDTRSVTQSSETGAVAALDITQADDDVELLAITCDDAVTGDTCSHHITTNNAKAGAIKITVNGDTKYLWYYEGSN